MAKQQGTKKRERGAPFKPGQVANPNGRPPGPNKITRVLKDAILHAAAEVGEDGAGKGGLEGFLIAQAKKKDNRGFMSLLGKVLPMTVAFDKNRPLHVVSRVELVRPEGDAAPREINPRPAPRPLTILDGKTMEPPPAPRAPVVAPAPSRSGT